MYYVVNNVTGRRVSKNFDTEDKANRLCRTFNTPLAGGMYGVKSEGGEVEGDEVERLGRQAHRYHDRAMAAEALEGAHRERAEAAEAEVERLLAEIADRESERADLRDRVEKAEAAVGRVEALAREIEAKAAQCRQMAADYEHDLDRTSFVMCNRVEASDLDERAATLHAALRGDQQPRPTRE